MLNGKIHYLKSYSGYNLTINTNKLSLIVKYFDLHPFKALKSILYFNWNKIYGILAAKKHLTNEGLSLIKRYNKNLNRLRKILEYDII